MSNLLVVFIDDMRADEIRWMPNLRRLRSEGTTFSNLRQTTPMCSPARACFQRGQMGTGPNGHGVLLQRNGFTVGLRADALPHWLRAEGYRTGQIGKYFTSNARPEFTQGWDWLRSTDGPTHADAYDFDVWDGTSLTTIEGLHQSRFMARSAAEFVVESADGPWHLWLCTNSPHTPLEPSPRHQVEWAGMRWPDRSTLEHVNAPSWLASRAPYSPREVSAMRRMQRLRMRELLDVDDTIGMLWTWLAATGRSEETTLMVWSDNGNCLGEHRGLLNGKNMPYDWSMLTPLVVVGPDFVPGVTVDVPCIGPDVTATCTAIAGATPSTPQDGIDLRSIAADPSSYAGRAILGGLAQGNTGSVDRPTCDLVATATHKLTRYVEPSGGWVDATTDPYELYDLAADPHELTNLAPTEAALVAELEEQLDAML